MRKAESRQLLVAAIVGVALMALPTPSRADDEASKQAAEVSLKAGLRWFQRGDYERAWLEFTKANAVYPRGSLLFNMGLCEMKLSRPLDALKHFRAAAAAPDTKAEQRKLAEKDIAEAYAATGHIAVQGNEGAKVVVDGQELGVLPTEPLDVAPGRHVVEAHLGSLAMRSEVDATAGVVTTTDVHVAEPAAPVPTPAPHAPEGAQGVSVAAPVAPPSDEPAAVRFWIPRRAVGASVAGVGVASLVAGGVFYGLAHGQQNRAASIAAGVSSSACGSGSPPSSCSQLDDARSAENRDARLGETLVAVGVVGAVVGAALVLWPSTSSRTNAASIVPLAGPRTGGLQLQGEF